MRELQSSLSSKAKPDATAGGAAPAITLEAWLGRVWYGRFCVLTERGEYIAAARAEAEHPDFAPPRYGYGDVVGAAIRQCVK